MQIMAPPAARADPARPDRSGKAGPMRNVLASLLLATAVGFGASALAADPPRPARAAGQASAPAGYGMDPAVMGHGGMDMAVMHCIGLSEQRLAAARTELKITETQRPQWNAFVEAEKSSAAAMGPGMMQGPGHGAQAGSGMMTGPLPDRLARRQAMMTTRLEALKKVTAAVSSLYEALTPDQRTKADSLLCGGMGGPGPGMAKGDDAHPRQPQ